MALTEADWKARMTEKAKTVLRTAPSNEALLRQAATDAALLTGHPGWDKYLQALQVDLDEAEQSLATLHLGVHQWYTEQDLRQGQLWIAQYTDRVQTLKKCMALPKEILAASQGQTDVK